MHKGPTLKDRFILYPAIAAFFLFVCYFIALNAWGYRFYIENGKIVRRETGIIIVATKPGNAEVFLDGRKQKKATPAFSFLSLTIKSVPTGEHNLRVVKSGYEDWERKTTIESGLVSWANYIILVPQKRDVSNYSFPGSIIQSIQSPDKNKLFVLVEDSAQGLRTIWEVNLQNKEKTKVVEEKFVAGNTMAFSSVSFDGNRVLILRSDASGKKYSVIENNLNGKEWKINELYGMEFTTLKFSPDSSAELYALKGSELHTVDYESKRMSAVIASRVADFYTETSGVFAIQLSDQNRNLYKLNKNGSQNLIIKSVPADESYQFEYLDKSGGYLLLPAKTGEIIYYYTDKTGKFASKILAVKQAWFNLSPGEENLASYGENKLQTYNFEKDETYSVVGAPVDSICWFNDQNNIIYSSGNKAYLVNFDGYYNKFLFDLSDKSPVFSGNSSANIFFQTKNNEIVDLTVFSFSF